MHRVRFSMAALLAVIALVAVVIGTLRAASPLVASVALSVSVLILSWAVTAAIWSHRREAKAFWSGLALFGWVFLGITMIPGLSASVGDNLITNPLLTKLNALLSRPMVEPPSATNPLVAIAWIRSDNSVQINGEVVDPSETDALEQAFAGKPFIQVYADSGAEVTDQVVQAAKATSRSFGGNGVSFHRARLYAPWNEFKRAGDSILALLIGLTAGVLARICWGFPVGNDCVGREKVSSNGLSSRLDEK